MRTAIVHDWLVVYAGAEKVLAELLELFPDADIFTMVDFLPEDTRWIFGGRTPKTSFIQKLPFAKGKYRAFLPLMPFAIEQFDLSGYDLVLSSSYAVAKGVLTGAGQVHVSYVHSPIRYAWDLQAQYLAEAKLGFGPRGLMARAILHYMRMWDLRTVNGVDHFIANSDFIRRRIEKTYRRSADVIYPPIDIDRFSMSEAKEDFYMTASRMVPYKRIPLIVEAFAKMPDKKLVVVGDGPEMAKVKAAATPNVALLGHAPQPELIARMQAAKAFVFAAEEDFGIVPVEAQACGTPIIALGKGGALETVKEGDAPTGIFFREQTVEAIVDAVQRFEAAGPFSPAACRANAECFSPQRFRSEIMAYVEKAMAARQA